MKPKYAVPDVKEYASLAESYETLKWRIIPRPGGATMARSFLLRMALAH